MIQLNYRPLPKGTHRLILHWADGRITRTIPLTLQDAKRKASKLGDLGMVIAIGLERIEPTP